MHPFPPLNRIQVLPLVLSIGIQWVMDTLVPLAALSYLLYSLGTLTDSHRQKDTSTHSLTQTGTLSHFYFSSGGFLEFYTGDRCSKEEFWIMTRFVTDWPLHCSASFIPCPPGTHGDVMCSPEFHYKDSAFNHCFILQICWFSSFRIRIVVVCVLSSCELQDHAGQPITLHWSHSAKSPCHRVVSKHRNDFHGWEGDSPKEL